MFMPIFLGQSFWAQLRELMLFTLLSFIFPNPTTVGPTPFDRTNPRPCQHFLPDFPGRARPTHVVYVAAVLFPSNPMSSCLLPFDLTNPRSCQCFLDNFSRQSSASSCCLRCCCFISPPILCFPACCHSI